MTPKEFIRFNRKLVHDFEELDKFFNLLLQFFTNCNRDRQRLKVLYIFCLKNYFMII